MFSLKITLLVGVLQSVQCKQHNETLPIRLPTIALPNTSTCRLINISAQKQLVKETLDSYYSSDGPPCSCGGGGEEWTRVAYLNMFDLNQQCPSNWTLTTTPIRGCGRKNTSSYSCDSVTYSINGHNYSSVCGRILAYQKGSSFAFLNHILYSYTIEVSYFSGVSLTHGRAGSRQHVWSFVGDFSENGSIHAEWNCPCTNTNMSWPYEVPSFINNNYFCDAGNPGPGYNYNTYYTDDPLWDGSGCGSTSSCCEFNSPPWFCTSLPQPTSDDLEIRNCYHNPGNHEGRLITLIEIYVK